MALSKKDAATYLGIPETLLAKLAKNSLEIPFHRKGNRYQFLEEDLNKWRSNFEKRKIILDFNDYSLALEFAFQINYSGHTTADFNTARQRGILKAISDWTQGALAEIAFQKFLAQNYNINIDLDFEVHNYITGQDITQVRRNRVANPPRVRVSIKSGKMNSCFIIIGSKEYELDDRTSDYYVFVRLEFPQDHLIRALKDHQVISNMVLPEPIPDLGYINSFILGYTTKENLEHVNEIPGQKFDGYRYVKNVGSLNNSHTDWEQFVNLL